METDPLNKFAMSSRSHYNDPRESSFTKTYTFTLLPHGNEGDIDG